MFNLFLWGVLCYFIIIFLLKAYNLFNRLFKNMEGYHYFILVKNGQEKIEWVIRSIYYEHWLEGKHIKISVFDMGSTDDSVAILKRLTYHKKKIDRLYTTNSIQLLGLLMEESKKNKEIPIILYLNTQDKSTNLKVLNEIKVKAGEIS